MTKVENLMLTNLFYRIPSKKEWLNQGELLRLSHLNQETETSSVLNAWETDTLHLNVQTEGQ